MERDDIPIHEDIRISKRVLPRLPPEFKITKLGYARKGALVQYRGPNAIHVHEYPKYWLLHKDRGDPRTFKGVLAHLLFDAPEIPLSVLTGSVSGIAVGRIVYETRKNKSKDAGKEAKIAGVVASLATGVITFLFSKRK
ncbi:MAG: hypothetical protein NWE84_01355 [Candidatus Bathyarchaeota archaeon]|nr:hypothetical protein [Candidatus Bathyarchaeota archaeon]